MINIPKGTKDVLPFDSYKWQYFESRAREVAARYHALEIRTPVFEHTELFLRSIGGDTDVVSKEMYTFEDKGGRSITLKPEGTAPVARSFVENSLGEKGLPLKMFYLSPVFRYERPQAGRLREHHQFGVEAYGSPLPETDFEVISLAHDFLTEIGITGLTLNLNSIGCPKCRGGYNEALKAFAAAHMDDLCPTCRERYAKNPLRILDCKVASCQKILEKAPVILDYICDECAAHMDRLKSLLSAAGISYRVNPGIVRGLDYYTKTVFEFVTDALGAQGTVCGGGRYDNLVESVGGKPTPCVGFGMGLERLILLTEALGIAVPRPALEVFVMNQAPEYLDECIALCRSLRAAGISCEYDLMGRSLKAQFKCADKLGCRYAIVLGAAEAESGRVAVKRLSDGTVTELNKDETVTFFRR